MKIKQVCKIHFDGVVPSSKEEFDELLSELEGNDYIIHKGDSAWFIFVEEEDE